MQENNYDEVDGIDDDSIYEELGLDDLMDSSEQAAREDTRRPRPPRRRQIRRAKRRRRRRRRIARPRSDDRSCLSHQAPMCVASFPLTLPRHLPAPSSCAGEEGEGAEGQGEGLVF